MKWWEKLIASLFVKTCGYPKGTIIKRKRDGRLATVLDAFSVQWHDDGSINVDWEAEGWYSSKLVKYFTPAENICPCCLQPLPPD